MQTQIVAIGNSYGLRLAKPILEALQLEKNSHVSIQLRKDSIVLRPAPKPIPKPATPNPRAGWFDTPMTEIAQDIALADEWMAFGLDDDTDWVWE